MNRARLLAVLITVVGLWPGDLQGQAGRRGDVLDANTASERQMRAVPGMTPDLARRIVQQRPFMTAVELDSLLAQSLTAEQRTAAYRSLFVQINLDTASDAELRLIPGIGERILGEFREYRPYRTLARFRREIGKYVDDRELARLEQYVFAPIDLNRATDADILSIPGVGQRILQEFKEYRPYRTIQQFRREIRKYVDDKEVTRLERYVTID